MELCSCVVPIPFGGNSKASDAISPILSAAVSLVQMLLIVESQYNILVRQNPSNSVYSETNELCDDLARSWQNENENKYQGKFESLFNGLAAAQHPDCNHDSSGSTATMCSLGSRAANTSCSVTRRALAASDPGALIESGAGATRRSADSATPAPEPAPLAAGRDAAMPAIAAAGAPALLPLVAAAEAPPGTGMAEAAAQGAAPSPGAFLATSMAAPVRS